RGTFPPLGIPCPPISWFSSTTITEAPCSRAMMAAGRPEAPAPTMTTSAVWSHRIRLCGAALVSDTPAPVRAVTPTPSAALSLMNFLRLTLKFFGFLLMFFFLATNNNLYERRVLLQTFNCHESIRALIHVHC